MGSLLLWMASVAVYGQGVLERQFSMPNSDTLILDSFSIIPGTLEIRAGIDLIADSAYALDAITATLVWLQRPEADTLEVKFRSLGFAWNAQVFHKDTSLIQPNIYFIDDPFAYEPGSALPLFDFGGLDYSGSFARSISFGNNRDASLTSNFDLQLSGKIAGEIEITAALTDRNLPIQPEGHTQEIRDFDQVFIRLKRDAHSLTAGDFAIRSDRGHFMRYQRNLQGLQYRLKPDKEGWSLETAAAVSRGVFHRNEFPGAEGNQGPYILQGKDGERFVIVLAGSERVWMNGELLTRGSEHDYVMDYNQATITFTQRRQVTKDNRIVVEFEYAVEQYFRSLAMADASWKRKKWQTGFKVYTEQDAKNNPLFASPDDSIFILQRRKMATVGDSTGKAVFPGFSPAEFSEDERLYGLVDTLVDAILYDSVFVFSTDPDAALFRLRFAFVGQGQGNYRISSGNINGRVYEWVAPENGIQQGSYEPVVLLVPPRAHRLATSFVEYNAGEPSGWRLEVAGSQLDVNTFSRIDDADDLGAAAKWVGRWGAKVSKDSVNPLWVRAMAEYEWVSSNFEELEPFRAVEFARDWNLDERITGSEHLVTGRLGLENTSTKRLHASITALRAADGYRGLRPSLEADWHTGQWQFQSFSSALQTKSNVLRTSFFRPRLTLSRRWRGLKDMVTGLGYEEERNRRQRLAVDSLDPSSFQFDAWRVFARTADSSEHRLMLSYIQRNDRLPDGLDLTRVSYSRTLEMDGGLDVGRGASLGTVIRFRDLQVTDTTRTTLSSARNVLGRVTGQFVIAKGLIRSSTLYELGSGQEQKREYTYLRVPPGQGNYIWYDDGDEVQELDEFELASAIDLPFADFVRIITPSNEFVPANSSALNQSLRIEPGAVMQDSSGLGRYLSRVSLSVNMQVDQRLLNIDGKPAYNPFRRNVADSVLVSRNNRLRAGLAINRKSPVWALDIQTLSNEARQFLTSGTETRQLQSMEASGRLRLGSLFTFRLVAEQGRRSNSASNQPSRNYDFTFAGAEPALSLLYRQDFRAEVSGRFSRKRNGAAFGGEVAGIKEAKLELRYNVVSRSTVRLHGVLTGIDYPHDAQKPVAYAMLDGLQPGTNLQWEVTLERRLANNLQISLSYHGRKPGTGDLIHLGRAQIGAVF